MVSGQAPTTRTEDTSVNEQLDIDDSPTQSIDFRAVEIREDESVKPVTKY